MSASPPAEAQAASTAVTGEAPVRSARVQSIDLLRGADVLLMLFVNEVAGVATAPAWLKHVSSDTDGMTITDVVFPAFLFIVGIAVPFALGGRLRRGESRAGAFRHVLARPAALVVMGVLMVNAEHGVAGPLSPPVWTLVTTLGVLLVWGAPESGWGRLRRSWLRTLGAALLVVAALAYRSPDATGLVQLRPHWWGILGLIGWAYLARLDALPARRRAQGRADGPRRAPLLRRPGRRRGRARSLAAAAPRPRARHARGDHAGRRPSRGAAEAPPAGAGPARRLVAQALALAAALAAAGLLLHTLNGLHPAFLISKNHATAPWGLLSSALTVAAWLVLFLVADVVGWRRWPRSLTIAGENPLVAYLLAPALLALIALATPLGGHDPYESLGASTGVGRLRSAVFAWAVARLTGLLRSGGLRVQL